jgi:hypothetical protein
MITSLYADWLNSFHIGQDGRGYFSATTPTELEQTGFVRRQCRVPALVMLVWAPDGRVAFHLTRPDIARLEWSLITVCIDY